MITKRHPTFYELKAELAKINRLIAVARVNEVDDAIATCKELIGMFELTAFDLGLLRTQIIPARTRGPHTFAPKAPRAPVPPKYRDPATGETWTGRGRPPAWIADGERDTYLIA